MENNINKILSNLKSLYEIDNEDEVKFYLVKNIYLYPLLLEAHEHILKFFPESTRIILELFQFLDEGGGETLCVNLKNDKYEYQMLDYLNQFDENWWLLVMNRARNKLNFYV